jgi:ATP-binding cassette subfamily F protein 3
MLLSVSEISKAFGAEVVLSKLSLRVEPGEKVALIGRNGTGKTTLLKIICGHMEPDSGGVNLSRGARIGYLRQEAPVNASATVLGEAEEARRGVLELGARLAAIEQRLASAPTEEDLEEYAVLHEHFIQEEGYSAERDLRVVLQRMGFSEDEFHKSASALSGGEKTRLALARLLLEEPDLLILDEPTNHLDLDATEWLESWLRSYKGAALIVSHDREFLQSVAGRIVELRDGGARSWPGPFDKFLLLRQQDEERQRDLAAKQQQEMAKLDEYVRRFLNSERVAQARGRQRHLNRMKANIIESPKREKSMRGSLAASARSGDIVLNCKGLGKSFADNVLFRKLDWAVMRGERWGVIGENGAGKSTLARIAIGLEEATTGTADLGANVIVGYFSQDAADLDSKLNPLDLLTLECGLDIPSARALLGRFLFSGEQVFQPIATLSGGEKNKLALARLAALGPNLLLLDEPTNHLDFDSRVALADVLKEYSGTLVLISHDRWLLSQVTDHTLDIRRDGVRIFPGSYAEYRDRNRSTMQPPPAPGKVQVERDQLSQRQISKEIGRLTKAIQELEMEVAETEASIAQHELRLSLLPPEADFLSETRRHEELKTRLATLLEKWTQDASTLEGLEALQGAKQNA